MNRTIIILLTVLLLPSAAIAMKPLSENDLLNVNISQSLSIGHDQVKEAHKNTRIKDDSEGLDECCQASSESMILQFEMKLFEVTSETTDSQSTYKPSFQFISLWSRDDTYPEARISLVDPINEKEYPSIISQGDGYSRNQILSFNAEDWKEYETIISVEEKTENNISIMITDRHSIHHSDEYMSHSDSPYTFQIMSGNTLMRETYIQDRRTFIQSGSWVDINPR